MGDGRALEGQSLDNPLDTTHTRGPRLPLISLSLSIVILYCYSPCYILSTLSILTVRSAQRAFIRGYTQAPPHRLAGFQELENILRGEPMTDLIKL